MIKVARSEKRARNCDKFTSKKTRIAKATTKANGSRKPPGSFNLGCRNICYLGRMGFLALT
jgi:hypothetical protein